MIYTAKSREELIEQIKAYLKDEILHQKVEDESQGEFELMYVLTKKFVPEETIVAASNQEGGVYMFYPFANKDEFSEPWFFDADRLLFELLGEGYEILEMTPNSHSDVWYYVDSLGEDYIWYKRGMQIYLDYCIESGVSLESLKRDCNYEGIDMMKYSLNPKTLNISKDISALDKQEIIRGNVVKRCKEYLKSPRLPLNNQESSVDDFVFKYVLIKDGEPQNTILAASNERYEIVLFYPFSDKETYCTPWYFDPENQLLEFMDNGYEIAEMSLEGHSDVWFCLNDYGAEDYADNPSFQKYLELCVQDGITYEKLNDEFDYDGTDLISLYKADGKEDLFMRVENFKNKPWYDDVVLFTRIGTCKTKSEHAPEVCKALKQLGYSVRLKTKDGELYILPTKDKKPKETEAR